MSRVQPNDCRLFGLSTIHVIFGSYPTRSAHNDHAWTASGSLARLYIRGGRSSQCHRWNCHFRGVFASTFGHCVRIARVDVDPSPHQPSRVVGQVISEIVVGHDMVDEVGNVTVASIALLVDMLTSLCLVAQGAYQKRTGDYVGVSQSLQFVFHAPAPLGTTLRISNTCISLGARAMSARCEVWDANADRLVCSAFHVKMAPSASKL